MLRKIMISMAAVAALGAAAAAPTAASAKGLHIGIGFGGYGYGYGPHYGGPFGYYPAYDYGPDYCTFKKVKVWSNKYDQFVWKTKKICY
jgi:hypothetical protein